MSDEPMEMLTLRVPADLIERADKLVARMARDPLTRSVKRSDVLRAALERGLAGLERRAGHR